MRPLPKHLRKNWTWCAAVLAVSLTTGVVVLRPGDANAALEPLPPQLARALALTAREARTQLPDGRWLVLERDGSALKLIEDREGGAVVRRWPLSSPRRLASLSLLPSGRVLIWGGVDARNRPQSVGLWFDPNTNTLTPTAGLNLSPRAGHAATVLSDGRLLISGGWMPGTGGVAQAELWDERETGARLADGALAPARVGHRSRLQADGRVRLSEGVDAQGRKLTQDQIYDPIAQRFATATDATASVSTGAPSLIASIPLSQSRDIATDSRLSLRFSEPLRAAELNPASVTLLGPRGFAAVQVTPAEAGRLLFVTPRQRLQANAAYSLWVDGVHGRNGQALAATLIDFQTANGNVQSKPSADVTPIARVIAARSATTAALSTPTVKAAPGVAPAATAAASFANISINGPVANLETTTAGATATVNFSLGSGNFGFGIGALQTPGSTEPATLIVRRSGTVIATLPCPASFNGCAVNLSQSGGYSAELRPPTGATLKFSATLSTDLTATMSLNSSAGNVNLTRRGQNMRVSFNATAGTELGLRIGNQNTSPTLREVGYTLYAPNGSVVTSRSASARNALIGPFTAVSGQYTLLIDPLYGETATLLVSGGPSNQLLVDGPSRVRDFVSPNSSLLTMDLNAGAKLGLGISGLSTSDGRALTLALLDANSQPLLSESCAPVNGGCDMNIANLPTGVYLARFSASSGAGALSYTAHLSSDKSVELTAAQPVSLNLDRPGQNGRVEFDLDPAQTRSLNISAVSTVPAQRPIVYTLYPPSGSPQAPLTIVGATQLPLTNLSAGRYSLQVDPQNGETANAQFELSADIGTVQVGGATVDLGSQIAGETVAFTFANHRPSADLGLGLSGLSIAGSLQPATVTVKRGDGSTVLSAPCPTTQQEGCELDLPALTQGLYSVTVAPPAGASAMQFRATISEDIVTTLQRDQPVALEIARRGQNALISFQAQVGETVNLSVRDQLTDPAGKLVAYIVRKPDGSTLASNSVGANGTGGISLRNLPADGVYTVFVDPEQAAAMSARIAFIDDFTADLVADGEPRTIQSQLTGQPLYLNFQAEQGANLGLGFDQLEGISPSNGALTITVRKPGGAVAGGVNCEGNMGSCAVNLFNAEAGTYSVKIEPYNWQPAYGLRATLSSDQEHSLVFAQSTPIAIERWGQNARYRFQASQGQNLTLAITDHSHAGLPPGPLPEHRFSYVVYGPDGRLVSRSESESGTFLRFGELEQTGEYTLLIDPIQGDAMTAQLQLNLNENLGHLLIDGDPLRMATQFPGQPLMFTFDVDTQPQMYLSIVAIEARIGRGFELRIEREGSPTIEVECQVDRLGCLLPLSNLSPGRYYAALANVAPNGAPHYAVDAILSTPKTDPLVLSQTQSLHLRSGQRARLPFNGVTGQRLTLSVSGQTTAPAAASIDYYVLSPTGKLLDSKLSNTAAFNLDLGALPLDGEYKLIVTALINGVTVDTQVRLDPTP
ncbi:MAG: Ig-like domain-containing protein [Lysobacter sp.]